MCELGTATGKQRSGLDIADIIRTYGPMLRKLYPLSPEQAAALRDIERCRTAALGGHLDVCTHCGHSQPAYNSCRNRHCPKCQALRQANWVESRVARTLPTHYFHVVFTLPAELRPLAKAHPEVVYNLLFDCASATLLELGRDPKRLGGQLGITAVLHTWARDLTLHPHVHCIVTGGALSADGSQWHATRPNFLFPIKVMRALFRGKFLDELHKATEKGRLNRPDARPWLEPPELRQLLRKLRRMKWVIYCKPPFGGPEQVIRYLGQYTHRVAISNNRLISIKASGVTFWTRDGNTATLQPVEFLRRFVNHVLPARFVKIRHYGLLATGNAKKRWQMARDRLLLLGAPPVTRAQPKPSADRAPTDWQSALLKLTGTDARMCPACGLLTLVRRPLPNATGPPLKEVA